MSGSAPRLRVVGDAGGNLSRLVAAAARLADIGLGEFALVGGLAVTCRLARAHRATEDVDAVAETTDPIAIDIIVDTIGTR